MHKKILLGACCVCLFAAQLVFAGLEMDRVRVFYRPDGGVSVSIFLKGACGEHETETECMDRITATTPYAGLPYDDLRRDELPPDRRFRDKWRGEKGKGVWVDTSLVTQRDKIDEYTAQRNEELDKETPNSSRVFKLQRMIEKAADMDHAVLSADDIVSIEGTEKRNFLASVVETVGNAIANVFNGVKQGFLALASLVTDALQVGTPEAPAGITVYDVKTKKPYCVVVRDGKIENIPGECGNLETVDISVPSDPAPSSSAPTDTEKDVSADADHTPPTLTLIGNNPAEIEIGSSYADPGVAVTDDVSDNIGYTVALDGVMVSLLSLDTTEPRTYTITYSAIDQAGNTATLERTVHVVRPDGQSTPADQGVEESDHPELDVQSEQPASEKVEEESSEIAGGGIVREDGGSIEVSVPSSDQLPAAPVVEPKSIESDGIEERSE